MIIDVVKEDTVINAGVLETINCSTYPQAGIWVVKPVVAKDQVNDGSAKV